MINRYFTQKGYHPYNDTEWKKVDIEIKNDKGEIIYSIYGAEFPKHFSQTACEIIASKYFFRGAPEYRYFDLIHRMSRFWEAALYDEGLLSEKETDIFYDEVMYILIHQLWAPNSPQWFNTGIRLAYGIRGDSDGLYYYDEEGLHESEDRYSRSQTSACFILDIKDQLIGKGSITDHYVTETKLFKGGSGCGTNFSPLRSVGEKLSSGGTSSGLMSYLKGLDVNAGTIKSGGTTRRAAKMVIVDIDHPEIQEFIDWKVKEEEKAKALIAAGFDASIGGEAYSTVSGQNSNNSVLIDNHFMMSDKIKLKGRVDDSVDRTVNTEELFNKICEAAWACGDPGLIFKDEMNDWNTCSESGEIHSTNPCGEFAFLDNTACNLSSINLERFVDPLNGLDTKSFKQVIRIAQLVMEASIYGGHYPTVEIAENSYKFRPTGLGISGLAGALEKLGLAYDMEEARNFTALICSYMTGVSYQVSAEMAEKVGPFPLYEKNQDSMFHVLNKHAAHHWATDWGLTDVDGINDLIDDLKDVWSEVIETSIYGESGFRNAQVTCIAPTGTISLAMDSSSTGIEPYFSRKTFKKLADGSTIEQEIEAIKTADEIDPLDHVRMVAAVQPHISGAVSKTVNLPNSATVEDIKEVFEEAWKLHCKSITVYRDGSKGTQVLETKEKVTNYSVTFEQTEKLIEDIDNQFSTLQRKKPDGIRNSRTHSAKVGNIQLYITVGFYEDGSIAEIFVNTDKQGEVVNGLLDGLSKAISHLLQYGVEPEKISKILRGQKYEPSGIVGRHPNIKFVDSISDLISKVIDLESGDYSRIQVKEDRVVEVQESQEERIYGERCSVCGSENLVRSGVCKTCLNCGTTTGCS